MAELQFRNILFDGIKLRVSVSKESIPKDIQKKEFFRS